MERMLYDNSLWYWWYISIYFLTLQVFGVNITEYFCLIADHKGSSTERWSKSDFQGSTCPPDACLFRCHVRYIRNDSACKRRQRCFGLGSKPVYNSEYSNISLVKLGPLSQDLVLVIHWLGKVEKHSKSSTAYVCVCVCVFLVQYLQSFTIYLLFVQPYFTGTI